MKWLISLVGIIVLGFISYFFYNQISQVNPEFSFKNEENISNNKKNENTKKEVFDYTDDLNKIAINEKKASEKIKLIDSYVKEVESVDKNLALGQLRLKAKILGDQRNDKAKVLESIKLWKEIYRKADPGTRIKADALRRIARMYWITGGDENVAQEIFKDNDFKKYLSKDKTIGKSLINIFKESYNIKPNLKSALELVFWYSELGNNEEGKKWLDIYEEIKKEIGYSSLSMQEAITLYNIDNKKESFALFEKIINDKHEQYLKAFPLGFYATYLNKETNKDRNKIKEILNKLMENIKTDPKPEYNQFLYFLKVQAKKEKRDLLATGLEELARDYPEFKTFLEAYGFKVN